MKAKISHLIFLSLASSVLFGGYLLTPKSNLAPIKESQELETTQPIVQLTPKKPLQSTVKQTINTATYSKPAVIAQQLMINEASLQANLNKTLIAMNTDESVRLSDLNRIAQCYSCMQMLQNYLLTNNLSDQQLTQLVDSLVATNHPEMANMLLKTVEEMAQQSEDSTRETILINSLAKFDSAPVAKVFSNYLLRDQEISKPLQEALTNSINETTTNRVQVANELIKQFNETDDVTVQEKLLAINHPETLVQISSQALAQDDIELYKQVNEQLTSNPSKYTLNALLSMAQMKSANTEEANKIVDTAYQLAERQFSGNRLDYIEANLAQGAYSEQEKSLVLDVLTYSEDQLRSSEIIAKFSN